jgi:hypothetical protein
MQGKIYKKIEFCQKNVRQREGAFEIQKERLPPDRKKDEESLNFLALFDRCSLASVCLSYRFIFFKCFDDPNNKIDSECFYKKPQK